MVDLISLNYYIRGVLAGVLAVVVLLIMRMGPFGKQKRSIDLFIVAFLIPTTTGMVNLSLEIATGSPSGDLGTWTGLVLPTWYTVEPVLINMFLIAGLLRIGYGKVRVSLGNLLAAAVLTISGFLPWASEVHALSCAIWPLSLSWYSDVRYYPLWLFIASVTLYIAIYLTFILSISAEISQAKAQLALGGSCVVLSTIPTFIFLGQLLLGQSGTVGSTPACALPLISAIIIFYTTFLHEQHQAEASLGAETTPEAQNHAKNILEVINACRAKSFRLMILEVSTQPR